MRTFQLPILFSVVSLLTGSIQALPEAYPATPSKPAPGKEFYLKTQVQHGQDQAKNGLYVVGYHIGAGLNAAALLNDKSKGSKAYFNGTDLLFDLQTPFPWGFEFTRSNFYVSWGEVEINGGTGTPDLALVGNKLVWKNEQFKGWIACDWSLLVPQLFWKTTSYFGEPLPSNCAAVDLIAVK